jgi:hypothetical protein
MDFCSYQTQCGTTCISCGLECKIDGGNSIQGFTFSSQKHGLLSFWWRKMWTHRRNCLMSYRHCAHCDSQQIHTTKNKQQEENSQSLQREKIAHHGSPHSSWSIFQVKSISHENEIEMIHLYMFVYMIYQFTLNKSECATKVISEIGYLWNIFSNVA